MYINKQVHKQMHAGVWKEASFSKEYMYEHLQADWEITWSRFRGQGMDDREELGLQQKCAQLGGSK